MMEINLQTKVADLLDTYPQLENILIEIAPIFSKLKNPILKRTIARVTSLKQAADIAGIAAPTLIQNLREAVGQTSAEISIVENEMTDTDTATDRPIWLIEDKVVIIFDACPDINVGKSPMKRILEKVEKLNTSEIMLLKAPFKPIPIMDILTKRGFQVWSNNNQIYIYKKE